MSAKSKQNQPIIAPFGYVGEFVSDMEKSLFAGLSAQKPNLAKPKNSPFLQKRESLFEKAKTLFLLSPRPFLGLMAGRGEGAAFAFLVPAAAAQKQINGGAGEEDKHDAKD